MIAVKNDKIRPVEKRSKPKAVCVDKVIVFACTELKIRPKVMLISIAKNVARFFLFKAFLSIKYSAKGGFVFAALLLS